MADPLVPETDAATEKIKNVCPLCSNGRPICTDEGYTHTETCATYEWATDVCSDCAAEMSEVSS